MKVMIFVITAACCTTFTSSSEHDSDWKPVHAPYAGDVAELSAQKTRPGIDYHEIQTNRRDPSITRGESAHSVRSIQAGERYDDIAAKRQTARQKLLDERKRLNRRKKIEQSRTDIASHKIIESAGDEFSPLNIYSNFELGFAEEDCQLFGNCRLNKEKKTEPVRNQVQVTRPLRQTFNQGGSEQDVFLGQQPEPIRVPEQNSFRDPSTIVSGTSDVNNGVNDERPNDFRGQNDNRGPQNEFRGQQNGEEQNDFRGQQEDFRGQQNEVRGPQKVVVAQNDFRGQQNDIRGPQEDFRGHQNELRGPQNDFRGQNDFRAQQNDFRAQQNDFRAQQNDFRAQQNDIRGQQNDLRGPQNGFRGQQNNFRSQNDFRGGPNQFRNGPNGVRGRPNGGGQGQFNQNNRGPGPMQMITNLIRNLI